MTLLLTLDIMESGVRGVHVVHKLVKRATIPAVKSKLYARANKIGVVNGLGALQYGRLKKKPPARSSTSDLVCHLSPLRGLRQIFSRLFQMLHFSIG